MPNNVADNAMEVNDLAGVNSLGNSVTCLISGRSHANHLQIGRSYGHLRSPMGILGDEESNAKAFFSGTFCHGGAETPRQASELGV